MMNQNYKAMNWIQDRRQQLQDLYSKSRDLNFWVILIPYLWLFVFFLIPVAVIFKISFASPQISLPPFTELFVWMDHSLLEVRLNFGNYLTLFKDSFYVKALLSSMGISASATLGCLLLGYMMAYGIYRSPKRFQTIFLLMVLLPFWTSFLVRAYAWMSLLGTQGMINNALIYLGIISSPLVLLDNPYAVTFGIIYCYLPFMILPIYAVMDKIDPSYTEAAFDLGCTPWKAFWKVTVPLTIPGIVAGCILVFVPAIGEFVIPELLGGPDTITIGRTLWWEFFNNRDWPLACALAATILVFFVVPIMWIQRYQKS
jgi:putrescine transport system permease protein